MRIGVTGKADAAMKAADAGFDYLEMSGNFLRELDEEGVIKAKTALDSAKIKSESINGFFPPDLSLYSGDTSAVSALVELTLKRAAYLGCQIAVVGSGKARALKGMIEKDKAFNLFCDVLGETGNIAERYGITVAIEPLNYSETDFINTVSEAAEVCRAVNMKNVGCLVDFYHFFRNGENLTDLDNVAPYLVHAHLARPNEDRLWPMTEDAEVIKTWAAKLNEIGYNKRISLECSWKGQFDAKVAEARKNMFMFE